MRTQTMAISIATMGFMLAAATPWAATLSGTVKVGNVFLDEVGDRSTVQETYNIYEGFALSRIQLMGTLNPTNNFTLDLRDINLDSRQGKPLVPRPGAVPADRGLRPVAGRCSIPRGA